MREGIGAGQVKKETAAKIRYGMERVIISAAACIITAAVLNVGLSGLGIPLAFSIIISLALCVTGALLIARRLPAGLIDIRKQKPWLSIAWLILGIAAVAQIIRLSIFMINPTLSQYSIFPGDKWYVEHCCLTAYSESARLVSEGNKNIYDPVNYLNRKESGFNVDSYHYPPPFLLLPASLRAVAGNNFLSVRSLWFTLNALSLMLAIALVVYKLEPRGKIRTIGTAPLIWLSMPVLLGLQISNVQIMIVSISIITWALFPKKPYSGGGLLAMCSVGKIFPGLLFIYLIARRKWKEVLLTAGFAILLTLLAFFIFGAQPFKSFIDYELPRLATGEAFSRPFSRLFAIARNMSPFGIALKLERMGVPGITMETGRIFSSAYYLLIIFLIIRSVRRQPASAIESLSIWLSVLSLGAIASPFSPATYVLSSPILLLCIDYRIFRLSYVLIFSLFISLPFFLSQNAPFLLLVICNTPAQLLAIGIPALILWRAGKREFEQDTAGKVVDQEKSSILKYQLN
ncbi:MAG TPA: glycosyltransferase family 87 protein [Ignavibacteriaceae bacterium]|nr:glycosyltransferase family 87 protein [Ignavibacteriaceae bacterium]